MGETIIERRKLGLTLLRLRAAESVAESEKSRIDVRAKRAAQKSDKRDAPLPDVPDFDCVGERPKRKENGADVERWWRDAIATAFDGRVKPSRWGISEMTMAKKLLVEYGAEEVQRGLAEILATWLQHPGVVSGKLPAVPTWQLIFKMREQIWRERVSGIERNDDDVIAKHKKGAKMDREAQRAKRRTMGEYNPIEKDPRKRKGIGW